ncbi:MAG: cobalt-precorrin-5B (C(1))-methyltransferase CbiD [Campylobacterales bacterium]|nr:cobalt-precorrin-5B (C(1))-methyltransferase CbiD [Campylobacterales bacterium]
MEAFLRSNETTSFKTNKMDNDDLDVTKGCEIVVTFSYDKEELDLNPTFQNPEVFSNIEIYAGVGVGVVTKRGLKISPTYPAINPVPLKALEDIANSFVIDKKIYCSVSVTDGEEIAKKTANGKVGVVGGISILGTTGFVKPISNEAYMDSIKEEVSFIEANRYDTIVFTIGNGSLAKAKESYKEEQIVEIGNFVKESFDLLWNRNFTDVVLYAGIGKMTKIAQGFPNTHNRFGDIDFQILEKWLGRDLSGFNTTKEISQSFEEFGGIIKEKVEEKYKVKARIVW